MRNDERSIVTLAMIGWIVAFAISVAFWVIVGIVAYHFITKYW